mgnify:CR=1 FL=1
MIGVAPVGDTIGAVAEVVAGATVLDVVLVVLDQTLDALPAEQLHKDQGAGGDWVLNLGVVMCRDHYLLSPFARFASIVVVMMT